MNTFNLNLDLDKRGGVAQWVTLRQGDHNGTELRATIYDHGTQAGGGYTCRVSIRLPGEGNEYYRETATYTNGVAVVTVDEEYAAAIVGVTEGYFELLQGDAVIASTESFGVRILRSAQDGAVPGDKYDSAIEDALAELDEATGRISQMVVDATAEYLEAHPEITTTVQDNSLDDDKLIQKGGILQREQWLESLVPVLKGITKETAEADVHSVTDSAGGGPLGITVYGRSTQDGTPTPDAPVPISSVMGNLYRETQYEVGQTWTVSAITVTKTGYSSYVVNGTSTGTHWLWGGGGSLNERLYVTLPAGTYTAVLGGNGAADCQIAVRGKVNGSQTAIVATGASPRTFTITEETPVNTVIVTYNGRTFSNAEVSIQLYEGSSAGGALVPYGNIGLAAQRTSDTSQQNAIPIDLQGHTLRSLPDGTRDEVTVDEYGHAVLVQRVGSVDMGTLNYARITNGTIYLFDASVSTMKTADTANNLMCSGYEVRNSIGYGLSNNQCTRSTGARELYVRNDAYTDAASFKTAMSGIEVLYALAAPQSVDLGQLDPALLPAPDLTVYVVPSAPSVLRYGFDVAAALAEIATS